MEEQLARSYIGGFGVNARLAYDYISPQIDPLSPQNVIILGAGVLSGTMAPGSARFALTTKLPEVNAIFTGSGSMSFACMLKYAGYDHIIITGRSEKPVYLYVDHDCVEICKADDLWGLDIYQVTDLLWKRHSKESSSVIAIGQAGERLLPISFILVDKIGSVGNKGGGAVFGSKNLKAIVAKGNGGIEVADPKRFIRLINGFLKRIREDPFQKQWVEQGIMSHWPAGDWSYRNRDYLFPADAANELIGTKVYLDKVKKGRLACPSCPYADKEILGVDEGEFKGLVTYSSGWSRANEQFGILCQVGSYDRVVKCLDTVQRYGLCRHAVSATVDYAVYLYEQGIITREHTDGRELKRDYETTMTLIDWMVSGHALGSILGKGIKGVATAFGRDSRQELFETKGTTITDDPRLRGFHTLNFEFIVNPKGHHGVCLAPVLIKGQPDKFRQECRRLGIPDEAISRIMNSSVGFNVGRLTRYCEDWHVVTSSLGLCQRYPYMALWSLSDYCELFTAATGLDVNPREMLVTGERAWNLLKVMNVREGFNREQDTYPMKWLQPLEKPNGEKIYLRNKNDDRVLTAEDLEHMIDDYYEERGWNKKYGIPTPAKLLELGLENVIKDLEAYREEETKSDR